MKHCIHEYQNTTSITDETLIYTNIKHCFGETSWTSNTTNVTGETLIYMNLKH